MSQFTVKKRLLSSTIALVMGGGAIGAMAQSGQADAELLEEVVVTGIRASLDRAMDVKRDSQGVVDAISAEDIGDFPDTNLAESLQRVTGVSIDRQNNEGSRVTVRGFGPDYNMITLNGRQMPTANLGETGTNNSRSFDFSQLAAESVSGVEIYKTGKASLTTGGIGSTINIKTTRPLENAGLNASFGVKAVADSTNRIGDDVTPEISGIYSNTFADDTFGVAVSASYQKRDSAQLSGTVSSGWNSLRVGEGDALIDAYPVAAGDLMSTPQNYMYRVDDYSRERTNAQATLQWQPVDSITATADYTYTEQSVDRERQELSAWFGGGFSSQGDSELYSESSVVTPSYLVATDCCDVGFGVGSWGTDSQMDSLGLNVEWQATDNLTLALDAHSSKAEAKPQDYRGSDNVVTAAAFTRTRTTVDFRQDLPLMTVEMDDGALTASDIIATGTSHRNSYQKTEIDQVKLDGSYEFDESVVKSLDFGLAATKIENRTAFSLNQGGNWGGLGYTNIGGDWNSAAGDGDNNFDDSAFEFKSLAGEFDDLSAGGIYGQFVDVNYDQFAGDIARFYEQYPDGQGAGGNAFAFCDPGTLCINPEYAVDNRMEEEQSSAYVQVNLGWDTAGMPTDLALGLRYEETDVTSNSLLPNYFNGQWRTPNELLLQADGGIFREGTGSYDNLLPNIDFSIQPTEDVVVRASFSQTIARPNYGDLQGTAIPDSPQARTFDNSTAGSGNPDLDPFESTNFDFSAEWYYGEGSYVSLGYYQKDVENFIGTSIENEVLFPSVANPATGPRYEEAAAQASVDNFGQDVRDYYVAQGWIDGTSGELLGDRSSYDPLMYTIRVPVNEKEASIDGFEFALQHMFGESGFGGIVNFTTVDGDIGYDNDVINENQFALLGLSDSANVVAFYDNYGLQARIAYNWRDEFLSGTQQGNGQQEPVYTEAYGQVDISVNYDLTDNLSIFLEGLNITEEDIRVHGRTDNMLVFYGEQGARYALGARYSF
ncbi:TonB-dependent receptor [Gilvimarinus xylanilyticus]|uniref:TonB-dependent receptor n=1 Tax=Gilvimarinus xylanilyticus TaxID=2944139 RepID=A0A9X2KV98_9GAMM|nr:TonB-dependent receptor [Gilvimarinus xylanilyticus]MCP8900972.1 TonB-dependent receptor [Gilvimarinus xylanilyticus]